MKKFLFLISGVLFAFSSQAQTQLWGMTGSGGQYAAGAIFKTDGSGNNESVQSSYAIETEGSNATFTNLVQASDGKLYGMTSDGGLNGLGIIFQFDPVSSAYTKKQDFAGATNGSNPIGSLMKASDGNLYGMTAGGGINNMGVLFQFDPVTSTYTKLLDFAGATNGSNPWGSLIQASNGMLYGVTKNGGLNSTGVLFQYDINTAVFTKLFDFGFTPDGENPIGSLMQASDGMLYGMAYRGGANSIGTLYKFDIATSVCTTLISFTGTANGRDPQGSLIQATDGMLYGMTFGGGIHGAGVLFQFDPVASIYTKMLDFDGTTSGSYPYGSLIQAADGFLYGITSGGGTNNFGMLFQFDLTTSACADKFDFDGGLNGGNPDGSLMQASDGKLYGVCPDGGINIGGIIFQFDPVASVYTKRLDFLDAFNGDAPDGSLVQASNGMLYGMTDLGGINNMGVLFRFDPATSTYTKEMDFDGAAKGSNPHGSLVQASDGMLYGLTQNGGINDFGVLFQFDPATSTYTKKVDFDGAAKGKWPFGSLMEASDGMLYGMTYIGGINNKGVLFQYDPAASSYTKRLDFAGATNGQNPYGSLIQASDGSLYGMTYYGGTNNKGVIFQFDPATSAYTRRLDFAGTSNGQNPYGSLIQATDGMLYGMTYQGGANAMGVLFQFDPVSSAFANMLDFAGTTNGKNPFGSLVQASDGFLYGMTFYGGTNNKGILFQFDPANTVFTDKLDFAGISTGSYPAYSELIEIPVTITTGTVAANNCAGSSVNIPFTIAGAYDPGNIFTAQISDATGSFASPVNIGNLTSASAGNITAVIPALTTQGSSYRIRVISSNPVITGSDNGNNITVNSSPAILPGISIPAGCSMSDGSVDANFSGGTGPFVWAWFPGNIPSYTDNNIPAGSYTFTVTDANNCIDSAIVILDDSCFLVWPGDANEDGVAGNNDILAIGIANGSAGTIRANATTNWIGEYSTDWGQTLLSGTDYKYVDCDGNGNIDPADTNAVIQNFGFTHVLRQGTIPVYDATLPDLTLTMAQHILPSGSYGTMTVALGSNSTQVSNLYGLAFTLNFDPAQIDASTFRMNENGTWMGIPGTDLMGVVMNSGTGTGAVQIAITRLDHIDVNGFGTIANLSFMTTNALTGTGNSQNVNFTINNVTAISANETPQTLNMVNDSVTVIDSVLFAGISSNENYQPVSVYPNPLMESAQIILPSAISEKQNTFILTDPEGRIVRTETVSTRSFILQRGDLEAGMYFLTIRSENKIIDVIKIQVD